MEDSVLKKFFDDFEEKNGTTVPKSIKKTLEIMDYTPYTISIADPEKLIDEIEGTIKNILPSIVEEQDKEEFFGNLFKKCPQKFLFFDGQKSLIRGLVKAAFLEGKIKKKENLSGSGRKRKASLEVCTSEEEVNVCKTLVIEWFKKNVEIEVNECKVHNIKSTAAEICLMVECPLCNSQIRCHKYKNNADQGWFISNLYKHVRKIHTSNLESVKRTRSQPISKFLSQTGTPGGDNEGGNEGIDSSQETETAKLTEKTRNGFEEKKYSRSDRVCSRLVRSANHADQTLVTSYFEIEYLKRIEDIIVQNADAFVRVLPAALKHFNKSKEHDHVKPEEIGPLLKALVDASQKNQGKASKGRRYEDFLKRFSCLLYLLIGRMAYELLYANLQSSLPSITTIKIMLDKETRDFKVGVIRTMQLKAWLTNRKYPFRVCMSEDQTKVVESIQYNSRENKLDGLSTPLGCNGFPIENPFTAKDALDIKSSIEKGTIAAYVNVFMVQPQVSQKSPAFCLTIYPTDNRFNYQHCLRRWEFLEGVFAHEGIKAETISSDGDPRCLKAMKIHEKFPQKNADFDWCYMEFDKSKTRSNQDTTHIGTKFKTRILNPNIILQMGTYVATPKHLHELIEKYPKSSHFLCASVLNPLDKMNFKSALAITSNNVLECLSHDSRTLATQMYLQVMQYILDSHLDKGLTAVERVYKIWYSVFFLRQWRSWIKNSKDFTLTDNFITLNSYTCVELNAHTLLILILSHIEDGTLDDFYPWLLGSQPCEEWFRSARSLTSTFSTVINFTSQEFVEKSKRIEFLYEATHSLSEEYVFPRSFKKNHILSSQKGITREDIFGSIDKAKCDSILSVKKLNMIVGENDWKVCDLTEASEDDATKKRGRNIDTPNTRKPDYNVKMDLIKKIQSSNFKVAEKIPEDLENSPFVEIDVDGKSIVIKKSCLVWMLSDKGERVSTDRVFRFKNQPKQKGVNLEPEKYYAVYFEDQFYIGRILLTGEVMSTIKFLKHDLDKYIWPRTDDICDVNNQFVFFGPLILGNYPFKLSKEVYKKIVTKYKSLKYE